MFLADEYKSIYDRSFTGRYDARSSSPTKRSASRGREAKAKGASKMYRNKFLQDKIAMQMERAKKARGQKKGNEGKAPAAKGKKGGSKAVGEEVAELMEIVDDLRNEAQFKDEEFKELRAEVEYLRKQNDALRGGKKKETIKAQSLEAKALKYAMMKELTSNADMITDGTFFDAKRDQ